MALSRRHNGTACHSWLRRGARHCARTETTPETSRCINYAKMAAAGCTNLVNIHRLGAFRLWQSVLSDVPEGGNMKYLSDGGEPRPEGWWGLQWFWVYRQFQGLFIYRLGSLSRPWRLRLLMRGENDVYSWGLAIGLLMVPYKKP